LYRNSQQYKQASPLSNLSWAEVPETGTTAEVSPLSGFAYRQEQQQRLDLSLAPFGK